MPTPYLIAYRTPRGCVLCVSCFDAQELTHGAELTEADDDAHADCDVCGRPICDESSNEDADDAVYASAHRPEAA